MHPSWMDVLYRGSCMDHMLNCAELPQHISLTPPSYRYKGCAIKIVPWQFFSVGRWQSFFDTIAILQLYFRPFCQTQSWYSRIRLMISL